MDDPHESHLTEEQQQEIDGEVDGILNLLDSKNFLMHDVSKPQILEVSMNQKSSKNGGDGKESTKKSKKKSKKEAKTDEDDEEERTEVEPEPKVPEKKSKKEESRPHTEQPAIDEEGGDENEVDEDSVDEGLSAKKKKKKIKGTAEMKQLLKKVEKVEEKLKHREQYKIVITNIALSKLLRVHKLTKNHPWAKINYGTYEWIAEYQEDEATADGSEANWVGLSWQFLLERNEEDRSDLIVTVCSKDLIIGRYIVKKEEFKEIPDSKSGFFSVTGNITNSTGKVGAIQMICQKIKAEKPPSASATKLEVLKQLPNRKSPDITREGVDNTDPTNNNAERDVWKQEFVSVRILSVAVIDLKSVHIFESNSPTVIMESGEWMGMTEPVKNGGMAAAWKKLTWKIPVERIGGLSIIVNSNLVTIGKVYISGDELITIQPEESRDIIPIIKYLTNGKEITGKLKINVVINHPDDILETHLPLLTMSPTKTNADPDKRNSISSALTLTNDPNKSYRAIPFILLIQEIVALDIVFPALAKLFGQTSVKLHCACNTWAGYTEEIEVQNDSRSIHWINLKWRIPINSMKTAVRITLWNGSNNLGVASIAIKDLLGIPADRTGRSELFSKAFTPQGEITGKLRITCRFEQNLEAIKKLLNEDKRSAANLLKSPFGKNDSTFISGENNNYSNTNNEDVNTPEKNLSKINLLTNSAEPFDPNASLATHNTIFTEPMALEFPIFFILKTLSIVDLISVHQFRKNSPQLSFACDRYSIDTEPATNAGSLAKWENLNWSITIKEDSVIKIKVTSNTTMIGFVELEPAWIKDLPITNKGEVELVTDIYNASRISTGKIIFSFLLNREKTTKYLKKQMLSQLQQQTQQSIGQLNQNSSYLTSSQLLNHNLANPALSSPSPFKLSSNYPPNSPFQSTILNQSISAQSLLDPASTPFYSQHGGSALIDSLAAASSSAIFDPNLLMTKEKAIAFQIFIDEIDVWELASIHTFAKNSPQVHLACGKWSSVSGTQVNAGNECFWTNLKWSFQVNELSNRLRFTVLSKSILIGTIDFKLQQLIDATTEDQFVKRISGNLLNKKEATGKIKITFRMEAIKTDPNHNNNNSSMAMNKSSLGGGSRANSASRERSMMNNSNNLATSSMVTFSQEVDYQQQLRGKNKQPQQPPLPYTPQQHLQAPPQQQMRISFPFDITIYEIRIFELLLLQNLPPQTLSPPSILIRVHCENFYQSVENLPNAYGIVEYLNLFWSMALLSEQSSLKISVLQRGKLTEEIAVVRLSLMDVLQAPANIQDVREGIFVLTDAKRNYVGKIQLNFSLGSNEEIMASMVQRSAMINPQQLATPIASAPPGGILKNSFMNAPPQTATPSYKQPPPQQHQQHQQENFPSVASTPMASSQHFQPISSVSFDANQAAPSNNSYLPNVSQTSSRNNVPSPTPLLPEPEYSLQISIASISVIDLPKVHRFKSNSPLCSIACGRFTSSTEVSQHTGSYANWENLQFHFQFEKNAQLRFLVSSLDKTIGICKFSRNKLINGMATDNGLFVVYESLETLEGKEAGKVKVLYQYKKDDLPPTM